MNEPLHILGLKIEQSDNGLYSVYDLWVASGKQNKDQPSKFLRLEQTKALIAEVENEFLRKSRNVVVESMRSVEVVRNTLTTNGGTYLTKELIYAYAMWINPKFYLSVIRAFDLLANDRVLEAKTIAQETINHIIKKREPNDVATLAVILGCTVYESRFYYDVLVEKELLTKTVNNVGQAKFKCVGEQPFFGGYKRNTMLFKPCVMDFIPSQTMF